MTHSLNSFKGAYIGGYIGDCYMGCLKGGVWTIAHILCAIELLLEK